MTKHQSLTPATSSDAPTSILPDDALVPVTQRQEGWTPQRQRAFIETLADTGCVRLAAQTVGMTAASAYRLRRRTDARAFDAAWDAALERSIDRLIPVAIERALHGSIRTRAARPSGARTGRAFSGVKIGINIAANGAPAPDGSHRAGHADQCDLSVTFRRRSGIAASARPAKSARFHRRQRTLSAVPAVAMVR